MMQVVADSIGHAPGEFPDEYAWLDGGQPYVICAYYTPDYLPHALKLQRSLSGLGINHFLKRYERSPSWEAGTRIKPSFVADCLARFEPRHVLYVDADAAVRQLPSALEEVQTDVAVWLQPVDRKSTWYVRVAPGTIYVRNTEGGRRFVQAWQESREVCGPFAKDGDMLHAGIGRLPGLTITVLPSSYASVSSADQQHSVIEHFQVSKRRFKWQRALRKSRQLSIVAGITALAVAGWLSAGFLLP